VRRHALEHVLRERHVGNGHVGPGALEKHAGL
jgi:hypothetical protein